MTGISHHTEATSGSPVFRIAAADFGELRTSRIPALSVLLMQEQRGTVGFGACGGLGFAFLGGLVRVCTVVLAFFHLLYYLFYQIEALKIELYKSKLLSNSKSYGSNNS